jgi:threonine/homoserine/homoserine lactone efflux protein
MMVRLLHAPFAAGLVVRLCMIAVLCGALLLARKRKYYKRMMHWLTGVYSLVFILHGIWIAKL